MREPDLAKCALSGVLFLRSKPEYPDWILFCFKYENEIRKLIEKEGIPLSQIKFVELQAKMPAPFWWSRHFGIGIDGLVNI